MRWYFASLVLLGLITVVAIVSFKGGGSMALLPKGSEAGIGLPRQTYIMPEHLRQRPSLSADSGGLTPS